MRERIINQSKTASNGVRHRIDKLAVEICTVGMLSQAYR